MLGISAAALLLGGVSWAISQEITKKKDKDGLGGKDSETNETGGTTIIAKQEIPADIDVAGKVKDDMTFEQAFKAARDEVKMGGVFSWHGHWYNTFEKEEWSSLSLQQRQEYTEMITKEELPIKVYVASSETTAHAQSATTTADIKPTLIEGYLNGQPVIGLDFDLDGVIDSIVLDGADGNTYQVVDTSDTQGLDTLYRYDSLSGELMGVERLDQPFVLSNEQFNQALEESMSREIVDDILEADLPAYEPQPSSPADHVTTEKPVGEYSDYDSPADYGADDATYINNGNVQDMDE
ncbi:hypothetical protein GCM10028807_21100 [Spirosoma daeguense]